MFARRLISETHANSEDFRDQRRARNTIIDRKYLTALAHMRSPISTTAQFFGFHRKIAKLAIFSVNIRLVHEYNKYFYTRVPVSRSSATFADGDFVRNAPHGRLSFSKSRFFEKVRRRESKVSRTRANEIWARDERARGLRHTADRLNPGASTDRERILTGIIDVRFRSLNSDFPGILIAP